MRYRISGAKKDSGQDFEILIDASGPQRTATDLGLLVAECEPVSPPATPSPPAPAVSIPEVMGVEIIQPERRPFAPPPYKALRILGVVLRIVGMLLLALGALQLIIMLILGVVFVGRGGLRGADAARVAALTLSALVSLMSSAIPMLAALWFFALAAILDSWRDVAQNSGRIAWALNALAGIPADNHKVTHH